jgi:hypothetical protein
MNGEQNDVKARASRIAHEFFGCVAGCHQATVERLQDASGVVPNSVGLNLFLEPLYYGLSFFGECARKRYTESEQELFTAELDKTTRWLVATIVFEPRAVGFAPPSVPESVRVVESAPGQFVLEERVLTKDHEKALTSFSHWREVRQQQFQWRLAHRFNRFRARLLIGLANVLQWRLGRQIDPELDVFWLVKALKVGIADDEYRCSESVLRVFAEGVVNEAYRIRSELLSRA